MGPRILYFADFHRELIPRCAMRISCREGFAFSLHSCSFLATAAAGDVRVHVQMTSALRGAGGWPKCDDSTDTGVLQHFVVYK